MRTRFGGIGANLAAIGPNTGTENTSACRTDARLSGVVALCQEAGPARRRTSAYSVSSSVGFSTTCTKWPRPASHSPFRASRSVPDAGPLAAGFAYTAGLGYLLGACEEDKVSLLGHEGIVVEVHHRLGTDCSGHRHCCLLCRVCRRSRG